MIHPDLIEEMQFSESRDYITEAWDIGLTAETEMDEPEIGPQPSKEYWSRYFANTYRNSIDKNNSEDCPF